MPSNPGPSQPISDEELAALMERLWAPHQTYVRDLLDEVYRLRAENTSLAASLDQFRSFPTEPGPGTWSTSYRMGYADAGRDVRALVRALDQSGEGQSDEG
jgi:hypothetical protein